MSPRSAQIRSSTISRTTLNLHQLGLIICWLKLKWGHLQEIKIKHSVQALLWFLFHLFLRNTFKRLKIIGLIRDWASEKVAEPAAVGLAVNASVCPSAHTDFDPGKRESLANTQRLPTLLTSTVLAAWHAAATRHCSTWPLTHCYTTTQHSTATTFTKHCCKWRTRAQENLQQLSAVMSACDV